MQRSLFPVAVFALSWTAACAQSTAPPELAAAVPPDAFAVVQVRSAQELAQLLDDVRVRGGMQAEASGAEAVLEEFASEYGLAADLAQVDFERPLALAFSFARNSMQSEPTWILPAKDVKALAAALPSGEGLGNAREVGSYVVHSLQGPPAEGAKPPRIAEARRDGLVTVRVDLAVVVEKLRPMAQIVLQQLEGMERVEMYEMYLDFAHDFLDSADLLDAAVALDGGELALAIELFHREDSPLADWAHPDEVDYRALAARLDTAAPLQFVSSYSQSVMTARMQSSYGDLLEKLESDAGLSESATAAMRAYFAHATKLADALGRVSAGSLDLDEHGMRVCMTNRSDPAPLQQAYVEFLREPAFAPFGLRATEPVACELAGVRGTELRLRFDTEELANALELDDADLKGLRGVLELLLGKDGSRVAMLPGKGELTFLAGGDDAWRAAMAKRSAGGATASPALLRAVEPLRGANPAVWYSIDVAGAAARFARVVPPVMLAQDLTDAVEFSREIGTQPLPASVHWGVVGTTWKLGAAIDHEGLIRIVKAQR